MSGRVFRVVFAVALGAAVMLSCSCGRRAQPPGTAGPKVIACATPAGLTDLDPALVPDAESAMVPAQVYEGLLRFRDGSADVEPALAEDYEVTSGGLRWVFRLKKGVTFHDGTPFDSSSVKFSVMRQMDRNHPYHVPGRMRFARLLYGDPSTTATELVTEIETPDDHTVVFVLARPFAPFAGNLAMVQASVVSPSAVQSVSRDFNTTMAGTGPFRLEEFRKDVLAVVVRNESYHGRRAVPDAIRFSLVPDAARRIESVGKGEADIALAVGPDAGPPGGKTGHAELVAAPAMCLCYLAMNCSRTPFDNPAVRRAVARAVDRDGMADGILGGAAAVAAGVIPPGMAGHNPKRRAAAHDAAAARKMLAEAGYPNGFTVRLSTHDRPRIYNPVGARLAGQIRQDLARIGITVEIEQLEFPRFLDRLESREYSMAVCGWLSDNGDPDNFIGELAGRPGNDLDYANPEVARMLWEAARDLNPARRADLYRGADDLVMRDVPLVPLFNAKQVVAVGPRVRGLRLHPTAVCRFDRVDVGGK